ncbi:MAG TPA: hypothetical protein VM163_03580 [bacterium]|nr:hypothetical protein [bacterium]
MINLSLFAAAVGGAVWLGEIWQGPLGEEIKADPVPPKRIEREQYSFDKMAAGLGYGQMVDNDLFRPDRKRYIPPEPSPTPGKDDAQEDKKPNFEVLGIMLLNDRVKYAIVAEIPAKKAQAPKPTRHYRRRSSRRSKPTPTPTPSELLQASSYRVGEEVKNGWYISEIRPTLVVFSNGKESFEVEVTKSSIPQAAEEEESKKTGRQPIKRRTPASPPSKDEATQRFLDALKKAGKRK